MKPPFPWFGGKSRVADVVWNRFRGIDHYVEPFAGSLAVLLERPEGITATVNDIDMYIANFWRAVKHAPDEVASYADWPVNECDLTSRHIWLVSNARERMARLEGDPDFYDAKVAGWWVWGIACWIGGGWCSGEGPWTSAAGQLVHLGDAGQGVNRQPDALVAYMRDLADRLRDVRICSGDWKRIVTDGALTYGQHVGIFLDPPYTLAMRTNGCYTSDSAGDVTGDVYRWVKAHEGDSRLRIALCGYQGEYDLPGWSEYRWTANRAYGRHDSITMNCDNRELETIWFSSSCTEHQLNLFPEPEADAGLDVDPAKTYAKPDPVNACF